MRRGDPQLSSRFQGARSPTPALMAVLRGTGDFLVEGRPGVDSPLKPRMTQRVGVQLTP